MGKNKNKWKNYKYTYKNRKNYYNDRKIIAKDYQTQIKYKINLSARYADYISALRKCKLVAEGTPQDVITSDLIKDVFGLDCKVIKDPVSHSSFIIPMGRHYVNA